MSNINHIIEYAVDDPCYYSVQLVLTAGLHSVYEEYMGEAMLDVVRPAVEWCVQEAVCAAINTSL